MAKAQKKPAKKATARKKAAPKKNGRPTKRTQAVVWTIIEKLSQGIPLTQICAPEKMPGVRTVYDWMDADPVLSAAIARARDMGFDALAEEALEIADDGTNDYVTRKNADGTEYEAFNAEHVQRSKLRVETRLKLLAKWNPKKYGDKLDVTSGGEKIQREAGETEKFSRLAALMYEKRGLLPDLRESED